MRLQRNRPALRCLPVDHAAHRRGKILILDPQHHLQIEEQAAHVEIGRADEDRIVDDEQLHMQLMRLIFGDLHAAFEQRAI